MYYIVETNEIGPYRWYGDADFVEIRTSPAMTNCGQPRAAGWCGATDSESTYAHGEFATIEEARSEIASLFGLVRETNSNRDDAVETYKANMSRAAGVACFGREIQANTTDERIAELSAEYQAEVDRVDTTIIGGFDDLMRERREDLRREAALAA